MKILALIAIFCIALSIGACGSDSSTGARQSDASSAPSAGESRQPGSGEGREPHVVEVNGPRSKLKVQIPPGPLPKHLVVEDLKKGSGPAVERGGDEILVNYAGINYETGQEFYNTWNRGGPSKFLLEETHKGWELGLKGMKAGGLRKLITPPSLEYGTDTLIYVIELVRVRQAT
jgi:peptidylprolyl isomerase